MNWRDSYFSYRLFENLRNVIQHRSIPIGLYIGSQKRDLNSENCWSFYTDFTLITKEIIDDSKIKKTIVAEIEGNSSNGCIFYSNL